MRALSGRANAGQLRFRRRLHTAADDPERTRDRGVLVRIAVDGKPSRYGCARREELSTRGSSAREIPLEPGGDRSSSGHLVVS